MGLNHPHGITRGHKGMVWRLPLEGRLQKLAETPPNYQGSCLAVSYCPKYPAAEEVLPILHTQDLANLVTYGGEKMCH